MALRRVIIVMNASRITATAMPRELRVAVLASSAIGCARPKANTTVSRPTSIVPGTFSSGSESHWTCRRRISTCSSHGSAITFSASVSAADTYR